MRGKAGLHVGKKKDSDFEEVNVVMLRRHLNGMSTEK